jgi:hypothetical protein
MLLKTRAPLSFATLMSTLVAMAFFAPTIVRRVQAQVWPDYDTNPNTTVNPSGFACAGCPGGFTGCTTLVPAHWNIGTCVVNGPGCNDSSINCGAALVCSTGLPTGVNCAFPVIVQPS